jgi:hypothetical protein
MQLCPILYVTDSQLTDKVLVDRVNDNHWRRDTASLTGIRPVSSEMPMSVFPNPSAHGEWTLVADPGLIGAETEVSSPDGKVVYHGRISAQQNVIRINEEDGVYFLRILSGSGQYSTKLVKIK